MKNLKFKIIFLFFTIVLSNNLFSQNQIDSIQYYYKSKQFIKGIKHGERLLKYFEEKKLIKEIKYTQIIQLISVMCDEINNTEQAIKYKNLLFDNVEVFNFDKEYLSGEYYFLSIFYNNNNNVNKAEYCLKKTIDLSQKYKIYNSNYLDALIHFNDLLIYKKDRNQKNIQQIKKNFDNQISITNKHFKNLQYEHSLILKNQGVFLYEIEDFQNSYNSLSLCKSLIEKFEIKENDINIEVLDKLTKVCIGLNKFALAQYYNEIGFNLLLKKYDENHKYYLDFLSNEALIKYASGDYSNAKNLYYESLELSKIIYGENTLYYGSMISNYATSLDEYDTDFENIEKYYLIDLEIKKNILGENNKKTALCFATIANYYSSRKEYKKAIEFDLKASKILEQTIGKENQSYAVILNHLGSSYSELNEIKNAKEYFIKSYNILSKISNKRSSIRIKGLLDNVLFFDKINEVENSKKYLLEYLELIRINLIDMNINLSQYEISNYKTRLIPNDSYFSILQSRPNKNIEINTALYENALILKNLSLQNQQRIFRIIKKNSNSTLQKEYNFLIDHKKQIIKLEQKSLTEKEVENYENLISETEILEKNLTRSISNFAEAKNALAVNWKQIQEKLQPNEIAIDLVAFNYYNKKWTDSIVYSAFVVGKGFKAPKYIALFEQKQLEFLLSRNKNQTDNNKIDNQYADKAISDLFLKPLQNELNGITSIYLSPSALGHQINFAALLFSENQTLGDKYKVHILGSTTELVNYKVASLDKKTNLELLLYGNIDYDKSDAKNKIITDTLATNNIEFVSLTTRSTNTDKLKYLAGSKIEINKINTLAQQNNFKSTIIEDKNATEESIKALDGSTKPFVLHLATHGFFFPDPKIEIPQNLTIEESPRKIIYKMADDPMMRSGLLFAGANKFWGKPNENITTDDGILTASEISNLDLSACQLVVLSACETGLGDINGSEGVFGLQRAFKMAGVKNIIMSLWKIDDEKTVEFFDVFYTNCFSGKTVHEAFQVAQTKMKAKYSPYYWAGFVLLE